MKDKIIPFNQNEILIGVFIENCIRVIKKAVGSPGYNYTIEEIAGFINVKTYLKDEKSCSYIQDETEMTKKEIMKLIGGIINGWFINNINKVTEKQTNYIEKALWNEINSNKKIQKNIDSLGFLQALFEKHIYIGTLLNLKNIVKWFDDEISQYLVSNPNEYVTYLLEKYEKEEDKYNSNVVYLPKKLVPGDESNNEIVSNAIVKYIDSAEDNEYSKMENLYLISKSRDLYINNELKFKADQKHKIINEAFFKNKKGFPLSFMVASSNDIEFKNFDEKTMTFYISSKWVNEHENFKTRFIFNTSYLIEFIRNGRFNLDSEVGNYSFLDTLFSKGKKQYMKNPYTSGLNISVVSLKVYQRLLNDNKQSLEMLISIFYNEYIVSEFGLESFKYSHTDHDVDYKSKTIFLLPIFDLTLRKIQYFLGHNKVDIGYIDFDDTLVNYRTIKSSYSRKNIYANTEVKQSPYIFLNYPTNHLYIDGESVTVYEAIKKDILVYDNLALHEKRIVDKFLENGCLLEKDGLLSVVDKRRAKYYKDLYFDGEIIYDIYDEETRRYINEDIDRGLLISDNNFLSKRESDRYSYIMDEQSFSDSLNLRNRYSHKGGISHSDTEMNHEKNYYTILMLFIQITLKFNLELCAIADS